MSSNDHYLGDENNNTIPLFYCESSDIYTSKNNSNSSTAKLPSKCREFLRSILGRFLLIGSICWNNPAIRYDRDTKSVGYVPMPSMFTMFQMTFDSYLGPEKIVDRNKQSNNNKRWDLSTLSRDFFKPKTAPKYPGKSTAAFVALAVTGGKPAKRRGGDTPRGMLTMKLKKLGTAIEMAKGSEMDIDDVQYRWVDDRINYLESDGRKLSKQEMKDANKLWEL